MLNSRIEKPIKKKNKIPTTQGAVTKYLNKKNSQSEPLFLKGDALSILSQIPSESIDMCMTSPPYWQKRQYENGELGLEADASDFMNNLEEIFAEVYRVLKPTGSFWLNIGDSYNNKDLLLLPYLLVDQLKRKQGWILRNCVIWNKVKGGLDNSKDRLGNVHEPLFHLVKQASSYFYDADAIRKTAGKSQIKNGAIISATGVTGVRYKRQIELSTELTKNEKSSALEALNKMLMQVQEGQYSDFRMIIRGQQRTTHSNESSLSGRAKELQQKGYYFLRYHPKGAKPRDVWEIIPEDTQGRVSHFAPYPEDLCKIPILATCPPDGIVLDPFCGTGTTNYVSMITGRKSIGIDMSDIYLKQALKRCTIQ